MFPRQPKWPPQIQKVTMAAITPQIPTNTEKLPGKVLGAPQVLLTTTLKIPEAKARAVLEKRQRRRRSRKKKSQSGNERHASALLVQVRL